MTQKKLQSRTNLFCFRCQVKLGKILNRGTFCPICRRKVCKKCLASSRQNNSFCSKIQPLNNEKKSVSKPDLNESNQLNENLNSSKNQSTISPNLSKENELNQLSSLPVKKLKNLDTFEKNLNESYKKNEELLPEKKQRKNSGLYIKRTTSSTADSVVARKYRSTLRNSQNSSIDQQDENQRIDFTTKQLSISCTELQTSSSKEFECSNNYQTDVNFRSLSVQNLDNLKQASSPKFNLHSLLSKLKRSHTIHNVDDIGKRSLFCQKKNIEGSNTLKNQYGQKCGTLWKRSSATLAASGHQLFLKTFGLGKKTNLFKRHSSNTVTTIPLCKLKGICSFCCKKIANEKISNDNLTNKIQDEQKPIPPLRKSNLVNSNKNLKKETPVKPERQFIVNKCVLEQSCSLVDLNTKKIDNQISENDSGLHNTNSLESLDKKCQDLNKKATTLPKTILNNQKFFETEKRATLKVRSHIEMNEDGTFYVQDSDWEMTSESDHWQKSDQFSSISSNELNDCDFNNLTLFNSNNAKQLINEEKNNTLCNKKNDETINKYKNETDDTKLSCDTLKIENIDDFLDSKTDEIKFNKKSNDCFDNKLKHKSSSVGEKMNELRTENKFRKKIKRSHSENALYFNVDSADDELEEEDDDEDFKTSTLTKSKKISKDNTLNDIYSLSNYSIKKEFLHLKIPDQCLDCFSSDEQLMSILNSSDKDDSLNYKVNHLLINKSPMLNDDTEADSKLKDDLIEIDSSSDKCSTNKINELKNEKFDNYSTKEFENIELNEEFKEKIDSINENYYNLYQDDSLDLESENDLEKEEQQYHLIQQRNITSLENLFSLETIAEEEDEEDYSLKDPKLNLLQKIENSSTENLTSLTKTNNDIENTSENIEVINSKLSNEELINDDEKSTNLTNEEELTTNDYRQFKTFMKDSNDENTILSYSLTDDLNNENDATESINEENFNSFNELGLDENVLIDDQQVIVSKFNLSKKSINKQVEFTKDICESRSNIFNDKTILKKNNKPEITKRISLFNKNFSNFDSFNKKTNENINKSTTKNQNKFSNDKNESPDFYYDTKLKKDFKESGVQIDFNYEDENFNKKEILMEDYSKSDSEQKNKFSDTFSDKKVNKKLKNSKKSNTQYNSHQSLDTTNSSGVDSGPSSELELEIRNQKQLNNSNSLKNNELNKSTIDCHMNEDLLKLFYLNKVSKNNIKRVQSMVDKNNKKIDFKSNKITRCCSFNIDKTKKNFWLEQDSCLNKKQNSLNKSKSMLNVDEQLNKNEKFLTQEEFNKRRRSYEINLDFLDQPEYMKKKRFNDKKVKQLSNEDVEKIKKELIRRSEERLAKYNFENSLSQSISNKNYSYCQSSDENIDVYKDKRISRKELNLKWKENLKRSDSLNSIVSIKSCYSLNSSTSDKNFKEKKHNKDNQDEYNLTSTDHYVIKETISDQLLTDNFIIHRSSLDDYNGLKNEHNDEHYEMKSYDYKEEDNDYEEIIENTYVDLSEALPKKKFTNGEHFYENFDESSIVHSENPYFSIKDFVDNSNYSNHQNYQIDDNLIDEDKQKENINNKINRRQSYIINDNFSYSKVKLPLKRSKSVPGNCNIVQRKVKTNFLSSVEKNCLNDQLEFQKKHLRHLHKQHWNYRCKNAINNNEEISNFFGNYEESFDKPPELLISYRYNKENYSIELFVKECRNFGNLSDKYLKLYLLPDLKKNKQKTSLQSKTIGHVNNLIEKKSFEICSPVINKKIVFSCDFDEINDLRTIWLSVWKNKKSLLEKSQCLGELFLKVTCFNDKNLELIKQESSFDSLKNNNLFNNGLLEKPFFCKESHLNEENNFEELKTSFGWFSLEQSLFYSGELILAFRYDTEKSELHVLINGAINLLCRKRLIKSMNSFCKIELKRNSIKNDEKQVRFEDDAKNYDNFSLNDIQKTTIIKNNLCPKWNKLFIFNDIPPNQLVNLDFEISIWNCQTLTTPYCISYIQLGSNIIQNFDNIKRKFSSTKIDLTAYEKIIQKEICIWQQISDKKNFNNWIKAWLQLKPID